MSGIDEKLKNYLIKSKVITEKQFVEIQKLAEDRKIQFTEALVEKNIITNDNLRQLLANHYGVKTVDLSKVNVPAEILSIIPQDIARKQRAVVFSVEKNDIKIALFDVTNRLIRELISIKTGKQVTVYFASKKDIDRIISQYVVDYQKKFSRILTEGCERSLSAETCDPSIKKVIDELIYTALQKGASDIHIEPRNNELLIRLRIDGILRNFIFIPKYLADRIVSRIKVLCRLRTDEHLSAQDGKMRLVFDDEELGLRVSIIPIAEGEKVCMRLLSSKARSYSLEDLGLNDVPLYKVKRSSARSYGMIICTGPTGSGKTTTIYSILKTINVEEKNVTSVEDPIEYRLKGANQVQVNTKTNLTFANGLRSLLRQDPDYIFVGEIRDNETAGIAINAALTGHLVFSTLHTNSAAATIPRLFDMKVEPFLVASTLNLIIAQRLVRKICEHCKQKTTMTLQQLADNFSPEAIKHAYHESDLKKSIEIFKGAGCGACNNSGYSGRVAIYEVLEVDKNIRQLIAEKSNTDTIHDAAIKAGMITMVEDGLIKVAKGMTTLEEILRVTKIKN